MNILLVILRNLHGENREINAVKNKYHKPADPKGNTAYEYDRRGNLIREKESGVVTASYAYDSTNRIASGTKGRSVRLMTKRLISQGIQKVGLTGSYLYQ